MSNVCLANPTTALTPMARRLIMKLIKKSVFLHFAAIFFAALIMAWMSSPAKAVEYNALNGVNQVNAVFDVTLGDPKTANVVFWAVRNVYDNENVRALPEPPQVAVVFHGNAVKLISSDREGLSDSEKASMNEFAGMVRQMKEEGVTLEICLYAAKVLGVDPATIMPEIDHVGNGFVSVVGYQAQGYSVVTIK